VVYGEAKTGLILVNAAHGTEVDGFVGIARGAQKRVKSARHGRSTTIVHDITALAFPLEGVCRPDAGKGKLTPPNVHW